MMKPILLSLCLLLSGVTASAQITISGTVRDAATHKSVGSVNVMLQNTARRAMFGYAITREDGAYALTYNGKADTLVVVVTGFNIREQTRTVLARTQRVDIDVKAEELKIREVTVKAPPVTRQSDTLTYNVAKYADVVDHSIGDVLKKLPGVEVSKSGEIKHNGKAINRFYVEDMDMLGGRYGIATNNIRAKDIASVQIYENHQPIKALKKLVDSDQAAINLKLKPEAKGTWNATMQLSGGYKPWMWNAEATAMYFGRKFQTIDTYKTNNTGDDITRELTSFFDGIDAASSMLGVRNPTTPALDKERYLDNKVHSVALNTITKIRKELELVTNAHYIHDFQTAEGASLTTYFLPGQSPLVVEEKTSTTHRTDRTEVNLQLRSNTDKHYLQEKLTFAGRWDDDFGRVLNDDAPVDQQFHLPRITLRNQLTDIRRWNKWSVNFSSTTDYNSQPTTLRIYPMLYPEVFEAPTAYADARQTLDSRRFRTNNSAFSSYTVKRWTFTLHAALIAQIEWMNSSLAPMNAAQQVLPAADTMRNRIYWRRLDVVVGPSIGYRIGDKLSISLYAPVDFLNQYSENRIADTSSHYNDILVKPSLSIQSALSYNLKFSARASYNDTPGGLYDTYNGYIMRDYRSIASKQGEVSRTRTQNYSASLAYGNAIQALFGSVDAAYYRTRRNLMYGTTYVGSLIRSEAFAMNHLSDGYSVNGKISKRFDLLSTTFNMGGGFSRSWAEVLRQGELMPTRFDQVSASLGFNTRFSQAVRLDYTADFARTQSRVAANEPFDPIRTVQQNATLNVILRKHIICRVAADHYYNDAIGGGDRNMFFLDAGISYKTKRMEYSIEGRNLFDTGHFRSASQSDITDYVYSYTLRPASVLFKIKFSLR